MLNLVTKIGNQAMTVLGKMEIKNKTKQKTPNYKQSKCLAADCQIIIISKP